MTERIQSYPFPPDNQDGVVPYLKMLHSALIQESADNIHADYTVTALGDVKIKGGRELRLYDTDNSHYVGFEAPSLSATKIFVMPTGDGTANQALKTNGSGTLGWQSVMLPATYDADTDGLIDQASGGTELDTSAVTNGQLLIGNTTGNVFALAGLTGTASQITVTTGASSITLSTPQNIHTTATPSFTSLTLSEASLTPMTITSTTKVANLNADKLDGYESSVFPQFNKSTWTDITASCTMDGTWNTYDCTTETSAAATWVMLRIRAYTTAAGHNAVLQVAEYGSTSDWGIVKCYGAIKDVVPNNADDYDGDFVMLPLDANQQFDYNGTATGSATLQIVVLGYVEEK